MSDQRRLDQTLQSRHHIHQLRDLSGPDQMILGGIVGVKGGLRIAL
jgi:hypothetical protein